MIQHRYGWTDEYILSLPYARLMELFEVASEAKREENRDEWARAAYIAYLLGAAGEGTSFKEFLEGQGIVEPKQEQVKAEMEDVSKEEAIAMAQKLLSSNQWSRGSIDDKRPSQQ